MLKINMNTYTKHHMRNCMQQQRGKKMAQSHCKQVQKKLDIIYSRLNPIKLKKS